MQEVQAVRLGVTASARDARIDLQGLANDPARARARQLLAKAGMFSKHTDDHRLATLDAASALSELVQKLRQDHQRLDTLLATVADEMHGADAARLRGAWKGFERCLCEHLGSEEQHLLPLLVSAHPEEVRSILSEHRRLRQQVSELGAQIAVHDVRKAPLTRLSRMLHVHARAEERGLYNWLTPSAPPA